MQEKRQSEVVGMREVKIDLMTRLTMLVEIISKEIGRPTILGFSIEELVELRKYLNCANISFYQFLDQINEMD